MASDRVDLTNIILEKLKQRRSGPDKYIEMLANLQKNRNLTPQREAELYAADEGAMNRSAIMDMITAMIGTASSQRQEAKNLKQMQELVKPQIEREKALEDQEMALKEKSVNAPYYSADKSAEIADAERVAKAEALAKEIASREGMQDKDIASKSDMQNKELASRDFLQNKQMEFSKGENEASRTLQKALADAELGAKLGMHSDDMGLRREQMDLQKAGMQQAVEQATAKAEAGEKPDVSDSVVAALHDPTDKMIAKLTSGAINPIQSKAGALGMFGKDTYSYPPALREVYAMTAQAGVPPNKAREILMNAAQALRGDMTKANQKAVLEKVGIMINNIMGGR